MVQVTAGSVWVVAAKPAEAKANAHHVAVPGGRGKMAKICPICNEVYLFMTMTIEFDEESQTHRSKDRLYIHMFDPENELIGYCLEKLNVENPSNPEPDRRSA